MQDYSNVTPLAAWGFEALSSARVLILPDGCRDLIVRRSANGARRLVSPLDFGPRWIPIEAGDRMQGLRLPPGVVIDGRALAALWRPDEELSTLPSNLSEALSLSEDIAEALALIVLAPLSAEAAARRLGVSVRSLQRLLLRTGAPFGYWRGLARVRACARRLIETPDHALADAAQASGYADQAHMTREMRRWTGLTPAGVRRDTARAQVLLAPGYG